MPHFLTISSLASLLGQGLDIDRCELKYRYSFSTSLDFFASRNHERRISTLAASERRKEIFAKFGRIQRLGSVCFWASVIRILPFSHEGVERTEIILAK